MHSKSRGILLAGLAFLCLPSSLWAADASPMLSAMIQVGSPRGSSRSSAGSFP